VSLGKGSGWRAATIGTQVIRLIFDEPKDLRRIKLVFSEAETERTQQFTLRWARHPNGAYREIIHQQWNFSPRGSTCEIEDYSVDLQAVAVLALRLIPDLGASPVFATLNILRLGG
jgi:hypothetical protein